METAAWLPAFFVLVVTAAVTSYSITSITGISEDQTVNIGDTAQLDCTVDNTGDYIVSWTKVDSNNYQNRVVISNNDALLLKNERYHLRADPGNSTYHLQITDIRDVDHGSYECQIALSKSARVTAEVKLLVRSPPFFLPNSTKTVTVSEGVSVQLQCYAKGYPPPDISWRKESNVVFEDRSPSNNILDLKNITKKDRGFYYCFADNGVGERKKYSIEVNVKFAPKVSVSRPRVGQALNYVADLECTVESYPHSSIYWLKNGTVLQNSAKYSLSHFSTADAYVSSVLRISTVEPADYGIYTCNAANEVGSSHALVEFFESVDPVCPPACSVRAISPRIG